MNTNVPMKIPVVTVIVWFKVEVSGGTVIISGGGVTVTGGGVIRGTLRGSLGSVFKIISKLSMKVSSSESILVALV